MNRNSSSEKRLKQESVRIHDFSEDVIQEELGHLNRILISIQIGDWRAVLGELHDRECNINENN